MNELSRHIEILLLDNDCVIVPGFGGFMAHHRPAEYVIEAGTFYPPQRTLGFNPQLKLNDSLLVQSYVEAYDISYPEAFQRIEEETEEIKQTIAIRGEYEFHGVGIVRMTSEGTYDFLPCAAGLLTPTLYALNSYAIDLLGTETTENTTEDTKTVEIPVVTVAQTETLQQETMENALDTAADEELDDDDDIRISMQTLRYIATAAIALLMFVFSSIPAGQGSSNVSICSVIDTEIISSFVNERAHELPIFTLTEKKDTIAEKADPAAEVIIEEAPQEIVQTKTAAKETSIEKDASEEKTAVKEATAKETSKNVTVKETTAKEVFAIVLASRVSKQGAEDYVARLKKEGVRKAAIYERGSMRKVVYGNFKNKAEAEKELRRMRETNENFAEAWISEI